VKKMFLPQRRLLLAVALTAAAAAGLLAAPAAAASSRGPGATAAAYLQARATAIQSTHPARALAPFLGARTTLLTRETAVAHGTALRQADLGHALDDVSVRMTVRAVHVDPSSGVATVTARAVTRLRWHAAGGTSVEAAGVDHRLRLVRSGGGWRVTRDAYVDQQVPGFLERTGVADAAVRRAVGHLEKIASLPASVPMPTAPESPGVAVPGRVGLVDRIYYDRDAAKAYADRYALSYNPTYVRFSADCCNFVSQSAYAGSMPQSRGTWETGWWYDKDGSSGTGDDEWSWSWISCAKQIGFWVGRRIDWASSISGVGRGDVIYYDWGGDGVWDHVAVLAGTNSAGQKVIDAHTTDHYRVYWKLGTSSTRYAFGKVRAYWVI
jgi:hypothetical protein